MAAAHIIPHEAALRAWLKGKTCWVRDVTTSSRKLYALLASKRTLRRIIDRSDTSVQYTTIPTHRIEVNTPLRLGRTSLWGMTTSIE